ncbi:Folylpolyglutamate synthase [Frankia sp. AiPs1]|uniref:glutamate ligase domain-containing protein n=1 Tax=Frankia sp. AiPa1 TaxID=573492 RepID=UPI00202B665F|nr:cyanophycin synthetase [Frankia sp. AiPa1]MCL9761807.1 dihydrofolate synthase [Frankia sp. AiPa1]
MTGAAANAGPTPGPSPGQQSGSRSSAGGASTSRPSAAGAAGPLGSADGAWTGPAGFTAAYAQRAAVVPKSGLTRLRRLLDLLGQPQRAFPSIVVTGSVGKSSTVAAIIALLDGFGIRAGSLRAPTWLGPAAQISVAGGEIPADALGRAYDDIAPYLPLVEDDGPLGATELLVAVAVAAFADAPVDLVVVESGGNALGGFGDLADLLDAPVTAVTPVATSWSGQDWPEDLDGLPATADAPVDTAADVTSVGTAIRADTLIVLAQQSLPAARALLGQAALAGATVAREGMEFGVLSRRVAVGGQMITLKGLGGTYEELFLPLHGAHQAHDAAVALAAVEAFLGGGQNQLDLDVVRVGLAAVDGRGRLEVVRRSPTIILDVADSPLAVTAVVQALREAFTFDSLVGVVAVDGDEALAARILAVLEPALAAVVVTSAATPAALPVDDLAAVAAGVFGAERVEVTPRLDDALDDAVRLAEQESELGGAGVLVTGSAPVVGRARALLRS